MLEGGNMHQNDGRMDKHEHDEANNGLISRKNQHPAGDGRRISPRENKAYRGHDLAEQADREEFDTDHRADKACDKKGSMRPLACQGRCSRSLKCRK